MTLVSRPRSDLPAFSENVDRRFFRTLMKQPHFKSGGFHLLPNAQHVGVNNTPCAASKIPEVDGTITPCSFDPRRKDTVLMQVVFRKDIGDNMTGRRHQRVQHSAALIQRANSFGQRRRSFVVDQHRLSTILYRDRIARADHTETTFIRGR